MCNKLSQYYLIKELKNEKKKKSGKHGLFFLSFSKELYSTLGTY